MMKCSLGWRIQMNEEFYDAWYRENKVNVVTQFAISTNRATDKDSLFTLEEEFDDEINELARVMFNDHMDLQDTQDSITKSMYGGL